MQQGYYCAYVGAFGEFSCNPRTLGSQHLNRMVSLEGIVTKCSLVRPKIIQSVHYSEKKDRFLARKYRDQTMTASGATSLNVYPQEDDEKNPVGTNLRQLLLKCFSNFVQSLLPNTVTRHTWTTKVSRFKKCPSVLRPVSSLEVSTLFSMTIWSTKPSLVTESSSSVSTAPLVTVMPVLDRLPSVLL